jgi:hypothetical protein
MLVLTFGGFDVSIFPTLFLSSNNMANEVTESLHKVIQIYTNEMPRAHPSIWFSFNPLVRIDLSNFLKTIAERLGLPYDPEVDGRWQFKLEAGDYGSDERTDIELANHLVGYEFAVLKRAANHIDFICGDEVHCVHGVADDSDNGDEPIH